VVIPETVTKMNQPVFASANLQSLYIPKNHTAIQTAADYKWAGHLFKPFILTIHPLQLMQMACFIVKT